MGTDRARRRMLALAIALIAGAAGIPGHAEASFSVRYGAVDVTCDDDMTCVAAIAARDSDDGAVSSVLQLARSPAPRSRWTVAISTLANLADRNRQVSVAVDGGVIRTLRPGSDYAPFVEPGTFYILSQPALDRLMADVQVGFELRFSYMDLAGRPHTERYPLDGLSAALAEIDRQQRRIVGDRRAGPPVDLPPAPDIDASALVAMEGVPQRLLQWHEASSTCEALGSPSMDAVEPIIAPLSATAMLYAIPCFVRSARPNYRLYLIESGEIGGMHHLVFAAWSPRFGWIGVDTLEAVAFDETEGRLTATSDAGAGGCGWSGAWTFDAFAFRLDEMRAPSNCAAAPGDPAAWPIVFQR